MDRERRRRRGVDCGLASYLSRQTDLSGRQKFGNSNQIIGSGGQDEEPFNQAAAIAPIGEIPPIPFSRYSGFDRHVAGDITIGTIGGQQPLHQPGGGCGSVCRSRCAAPEPSAPPREGIKNTIAPAGNVGERARCRAPRPVRSRPAPMCSDPVAANSSTARAPSIGPQRNLLNRKISGSRRSSSAAPESAAPTPAKG